jgi:hypothetical protein
MIVTNRFIWLRVQSNGALVNTVMNLRLVYKLEVLLAELLSLPSKDSAT